MFESGPFQRLFAPLRALRWRLHRWSSAEDRQFWDQQFTAPSYDPFSSSYPGRVTIRRFSDLAEPHLHAVRIAVDLGCGPGEITCELARRAPDTRFLGFDHSAVAIAQARAHAGRSGIGNVVFEQADLETFVPPPGTGLVMMFDAFHHLLDPEAFVRRVSPVCDRFFLIEPAGTVLGTWNRTHDLDWIAQTVFQIRDRLEFEFGVAPSTPAAPTVEADNAPPAGAPTEHRYTTSDFERFFPGFSLEIRGTVAGLEHYGPDPGRHSPLRDRFGEAAYQLLVGIEQGMYDEGLDLAAKHWAIYASPRVSGAISGRSIRRPPVKPRVGGLLPAYAAQYRGYEGPTRVRGGELFHATLRVKNTGWRPWNSTEASPILASYHWLDRTGRRLSNEGLRTALPGTVGPGEEAELLLRVEAPQAPGRVVLSIDLVHEGTTWFSDQGVVPYRVRVTVDR